MGYKHDKKRKGKEDIVKRERERWKVVNKEKRTNRGEKRSRKK